MVMAPPPLATPPPAPPLAASCADRTEGQLTLPGGRFRCREVPLAIDFPDGVPLKRTTSPADTIYLALFDRGALAIVLHPHFVDNRAATRDGARSIIDTVVKMLAPTGQVDAVEVPRLENAEADAGARFSNANPRGLGGEIRAYFTQGWYVSLVALGETGSSAHPDGDAGRRFLESARLPRLPQALQRVELGGGASFQIPAHAWPLHVADGNFFYAIPDAGMAIGVRTMERNGRSCAQIMDNDPQRILRELETEARIPSKVVIKKLEPTRRGELLYADADVWPDGAQVPMSGSTYLACRGSTYVQLMVAGHRNHAVLRPLLEKLTATFVGAPM
jgi:hypothetical protein